MTTNIGGTLAVFGANSDHRGESNHLAGHRVIPLP